MESYSPHDPSAQAGNISPDLKLQLEGKAHFVESAEVRLLKDAMEGASNVPFDLDNIHNSRIIALGGATTEYDTNGHEVRKNESGSVEIDAADMNTDYYMVIPTTVNRSAEIIKIDPSLLESKNKGEELTIGRAKDRNDIIIPDSFVSAVHAHVKHSEKVDNFISVSSEATNKLYIVAVNKEAAQQEAAVETSPRKELLEKIAGTVGPAVTEAAEVSMNVESTEANENMNPERIAMQELHDKWRLPEGATAETAVRVLNESLEQIKELGIKVGYGSDLTNSLIDLQHRFKDTLDSNMPHFNQELIMQTSDRLVGVGRAITEVLSQDLLLPMQTRYELEQSVQDVTRLGDMLRYTVPQPGVVDTDVVYDALRAMVDSPAEKVYQQALVAQRQIEEKHIELMGYANATAVEEDSSKTEQFANSQVAELAEVLRDEGLSDEIVEKAILTMERIIDNTVEDKSSSIPFPSRVAKNGEVPRKHGDKMGQKTSSQRYVAEMAVDMLRGKFNFKNNPQDIVVKQDGTVEEGMHRAAALITLYGKDWLEIAEKQGFKIIRK